jgi:hypothetical protein
MLWLFGLWLGPGYLLARFATAGTDSTWARLWLPVAIIWLLYPVSQLSSLSASTIWLPLTPDVFARLAQKPAITLGFYALSIPVLALAALAFKWAFLTKGDWELLFVGAPLLIVSGFLYARLIGRLAFLLRFTRSLVRAKKKKKPKPDAEPQSAEEPEPKPSPVQTRELPPINTLDGELTGYDVKYDEEETPPKRMKAEVIEDDAPATRPKSRAKPPPLPKRRPETSEERARAWDDEEDDEPTAYDMREAEVVPRDNTPKEIVKPKEEEMRLLSRDDVPKKPKIAWGAELLVFLGQPGTLSAIVIATALCVMVGVMVRVARDFNPLD